MERAWKRATTTDPIIRRATVASHASGAAFLYLAGLGWFAYAMYSSSTLPLLPALNGGR